MARVNHAATRAKPQVSAICCTVIASACSVRFCKYIHPYNNNQRIIIMAPAKKVGPAPKKRPAKKTAKKKIAPSVEFSAKGDDTAAGAPAVVTPKKKKHTVKKAAAKTTAPAKTAPAKKRSVKKASTTTAKKRPTKKVAKGTSGRSLPRDMNEHGFVKGSNSETIVNLMLEGGSSRAEVAAKVAKTIKSTDGKPVNAPALMSGLVHRLMARGYTIEQTWVLREPTPASKAAATRAAKKAAKKAQG